MRAEGGRMAGAVRLTGKLGQLSATEMQRQLPPRTGARLPQPLSLLACFYLVTSIVRSPCHRDTYPAPTIPALLTLCASKLTEAASPSSRASSSFRAVSTLEIALGSHFTEPAKSGLQKVTVGGARLSLRNALHDETPIK